MTEETKPTTNDNALADEILRTVLSHGDKDEKVKLSDALTLFALLVLRFISPLVSPLKIPSSPKVATRPKRTLTKLQLRTKIKVPVFTATLAETIIFVEVG